MSIRCSTPIAYRPTYEKKEGLAVIFDKALAAKPAECPPIFCMNQFPLSEVVEAQGHLIDSHIMERIFDTVVEFGGRFEVEQFSIGRTNSDASRLRLRWRPRVTS